MIRFQNVIRLMALGLAIAWSVAGWAQQDSDTPPKDEHVQGKKERGREKKSTPKTNADDLKLRQRELHEQIRRLTEGRLRNRPGASAWPFSFDLHGAWLFSEPRSMELGASFDPADESLRTQLGLPEGQGLVVTSVAPEGPASRVGLKVNDVLTTLNDQPLATLADLVKRLKDAGEKAIPLKLLRSGKPMTIQIKPEYHVTFGPVEPSRPRYQLGVQVTPLDDTLRAQLGIPDREGLLVGSVESESGAEKAGLKRHDILLSVGEQSLRAPEDLIKQLQKSSGKALTFKVLRGGKTITVEVTPSAGKDTASDILDLNLAPGVRAVRPTYLPLPQSFDLSFPVPKPSERQIGDLRNEVRELRRSVEQLQKSLRANPDSDRQEK